MFKTVICTIVYSRTWYIWWKKNILPISNLFGNLLTKFNCNFFVFTYVMYATRGRFLLLHPFLLFLLSNFWQVFCKSYWNSELIFKGQILRSLFLSKYAMNFINIYMSNYPNISGYMSPPISSYTRCLMVSTDQADSHCFYFRISWILMEWCWFYFFVPSI